MKTMKDNVEVQLKPVMFRFTEPPQTQRDTATAVPVGLLVARPIDLLNSRKALPTDTTVATMTAGTSSGIATP